LGKVLIKDDEKEEMHKKEKKYIEELKNKRKNQKEMSADNVRILFLMQGVLLDLFIKAVKINTVTNSSFVGSILRFVDNVNKHFLTEGCFFSLIFTTSRDEHFGYWFDEEESVFKITEFTNNPLLEIINDEATEYNRQYVIKDIFQCESKEVAQAAVRCYENLNDIAQTSVYNQFKLVKPEQTLWLAHFVKIRNLKYTSKSCDETIKSVTFFSALQMYTLKSNLLMRTSNPEKIAEAAAAQQVNTMKMNKRLSINLNKASINMNPESMLKEIQEINPAIKSYDEVYKQVSVFLNFFLNYTEFIQLLSERTALESVNYKLFEKITDSLDEPEML